MKRLIFAALATVMLANAGCIVRDRGPRHRTVHKKQKGCGPAHHWNGHACVHNGKAKGHRK
ncbi:MAG: hypothetical protein KF773_22930 [Deltaproteobacteria bacterium]|nr:hypothetical protein [Deltaproteobacteria bacterium]MCW5806736.1 hypothetical protein [Deltaproteobacteria bacterium]